MGEDNGWWVKRTSDGDDNGASQGQNKAVKKQKIVWRMRALLCYDDVTAEEYKAHFTGLAKGEDNV